jgi:hypothetical protein
MPGDRGRFALDPLHHVAVAGDRPDAVVDDPVVRRVEAVRHHARGDRHADAVADALPERAGRRLDAGRAAVLRVPRRMAPPLAEAPDLVQAQVVPREVQEGVEEHRAVPRRQDEPVAIRPVGTRRIEAQVTRPQEVGIVGGPHRQAGMTRLRLLDRVDGQHLDRVDGESVQIGPGGGCRHVASAPGQVVMRLAAIRACSSAGTATGYSLV